VSAWDVHNGRMFGLMFAQMPALTSLDVSTWDVGNGRYFDSMFGGTSSLASLDVAGWDVREGVSFGFMFSGASALTSLDLSAWDVRNATDFLLMFEGTSSLTSLDVAGWDVRSGTRFEQMFARSALGSLDLSGWDTMGADSTSLMLWEMPNLAELVLGGRTMLQISTALAPLPADARYTGAWVAVGAGTTMVPQGPWSGSSDDLVEAAQAGGFAGTYIPAQRVTVLLDPNAADAEAAGSTLIAGATGVPVTLPGAAFTRPEQRLSGWNTRADGTGTAYGVDSALFLPGGDITVYAQWTALGGGVTEVPETPELPLTEPEGLPLTEPEGLPLTAPDGLALTGVSGSALVASIAGSLTAGGAALLALAGLRRKRKVEPEA
jgi:surface protein